MDIKELIMHPAQLEEVQLLKVVCERTDDYNPENQKLDITINVNPEVVNTQCGKSKIDVKVEGDGFSIQVIEVGVFTFEDIENEITCKNFLEVQGVRLLWSYIREIIYDLSGKLLRKPILIPTIDVIKTIEHADKEN